MGRFSLKKVYTLHILVWNQEWFARELHECINVFVILIPNEQESRITCEFEMYFKQMQVILGLKRGVDNESFCLK